MTPDFSHLFLDIDTAEAMSLDDAMAHTNRVLDEVTAFYREHYTLVGRVALFSGGNDSSTFLHLLRDRIDKVGHVNTGIGVPETAEYVRRVCREWDLDLIEAHPPEGETYRDLVLKYGFPGPGQHGLMYRTLKERALRTIRRGEIGKRGRTHRVMFVAGMRHFESNRRMRNTELTHTEGAIVWLSPIAYWTNDHMREYRERFNVPRNEVSDNLHMSGECLCGAFAAPGELEHIRFFYPNVAAMIDGLQEEVAATDKPAVWGVRPPKKATVGSVRSRLNRAVNNNDLGPLCAKCDLLPED